MVCLFRRKIDFETRDNSLAPTLETMKTNNAEYAYRRVQDVEKRRRIQQKEFKKLASNTPLNTPIKLNNKHNIIEATNATDLYHCRTETDVSNVAEMATLLKNHFNKIAKLLLPINDCLTAL